MWEPCPHDAHATGRLVPAGTLAPLSVKVSLVLTVHARTLCTRPVRASRHGRLAGSACTVGPPTPDHCEQLGLKDKYLVANASGFYPLF